MRTRETTAAAVTGSIEGVLQQNVVRIGARVQRSERGCQRVAVVERRST